MNLETNRLNTFINWSSSGAVDPRQLAKSGFFYTGEGTEVECFSCSGKINEWNNDDSVFRRHQQLDPDCELVKDPHCTHNIPIEETGHYPDVETSSFQYQAPSAGFGAQDYGRREEDEVYKSEALRLLSFVNWRDAGVRPQTLVKAGFYLTADDEIRCAYCGGQLPTFNNLGSVGDLIDVHRIYFPRCVYAAVQATRRPGNTSTAYSLRVSRESERSGPAEWRPAAPARRPASQPSQLSAAIQNERMLAALGGGGGGEGVGVGMGMGVGSGVGVGAGRARGLRALGVVGVSGGARHPALAALTARLDTYRRPLPWPQNRKQTPMALADAGFFYAGTEDQVRCFYCDGGLGKWEAADEPWREHARWFPHCGYVLLAKGQLFVDQAAPSIAPGNVGRGRRRDTSRVLGSGPLPPGPAGAAALAAQVARCMESDAVSAALATGLDAARVRRAVVRRLQDVGTAFPSADALIDAVLDVQLSEEPWGTAPARLARDILADTLRDFGVDAARESVISSPQDSESEGQRSPSPVRRPPSPPPRLPPSPLPPLPSSPAAPPVAVAMEAAPVRTLSLEEENRQLKEARLCKVCMDHEVSLVFLPCGHLVSCESCGAALAACPLCRAAVKALVRAYLA